MNYERFSELWDALVRNRPKGPAAAPISNGMTDETATALIEYADGKKAKIESVRKILASASPA